MIRTIILYTNAITPFSFTRGVKASLRLSYKDITLFLSGKVTVRSHYESVYNNMNVTRDKPGSRQFVYGSKVGA